MRETGYVMRDAGDTRDARYEYVVSRIPHLAPRIPHPVTRIPHLLLSGIRGWWHLPSDCSMDLVSRAR